MDTSQAIYIGELGPYVNLECDGHVTKITEKKMHIYIRSRVTESVSLQNHYVLTDMYAITRSH